MEDELKKEIDTVLENSKKLHLTDEEMEKLKQQIKEDQEDPKYKDWASYTGDEILELVKRDLKGDPEAKEILKTISKNKLGRDVIKLARDNLNLINLINKDKKQYRTRARAENTPEHLVTDYPDALIVPTLTNYENAVSLTTTGNAYLTPLPGLEGLKFDNGKMFFENMPIGEAQLQNMKTKEYIESIDLQLLRTFYSIILCETGKAKKRLDVISLFVPDFAKYIGRQNLTQERIDELVKQVQTFHNIVGLVKGSWGESIYPVLNFEGYDKETNKISFSSPYLTYVIDTIFNASKQYTTKGKPQLKRNGEHFTLPSHSYLIYPALVKERDNRACENVVILVTGIEKCGNNDYSIKASTLVEKNTLLTEAITGHSNPNILVKRCFSNTWAYLKRDTALLTTYKDIKINGIPLADIDPKDPSLIPTYKNMKNHIFTITHKGKNKG